MWYLILILYSTGDNKIPSATSVVFDSRQNCAIAAETIKENIKSDGTLFCVKK